MMAIESIDKELLKEVCNFIFDNEEALLYREVGYVIENGKEMFAKNIIQAWEEKYANKETQSD